METTQPALGGSPFNLQGGGVEFLSRPNDLFQPGSAARWKCQYMFIHVCVEQSLKYIIHTESAQNYLFQKNNSRPPPGDWMVAPSAYQHGTVRCLNYGPVFPTLCQHWDNIGWAPCVAWVADGS